jgi:hypothetical protein
VPQKAQRLRLTKSTKVRSHFSEKFVFFVGEALCFLWPSFVTMAALGGIDA